jgi:SpoVK/Ycf46/Vps4 family AAA+-type ATPase
MTSNLPKNIDEAFSRRVHVSIEFPVPGPKERERIWELSIPKGAPVVDLDIAWLAKTFELTGGAIRNAALSAAFIAADAGVDITMDTLTTAVRRELRKMGRLLDDDLPSPPRRRASRSRD